MRLSSVQRRQLQKGDYTPLVFDVRPVEGPCCMVLTWSKQQRDHDGAGGQLVMPRRAVRWIEVTSIKRHRKGGWQVRFDVTDLRQDTRFLRSTPPVWDPHRGKASDATKEADMSSYTSSRWASIDELEAVPDRWQSGESKKAYQHDHALRLERVAAARTDKWRFNRSRRKAIAALRPAA